MKTIIILAHPNVGQSHINKTWVEALAKTNPDIDVHDLYKTYPDEKIDVAAEQALLIGYDRIIFQYPLQWYNMPSLLKKWFDEVFLMGWAYGQGGENLNGKEFGVVISTAGLDEVYKESVFGTIEQLLKPIESTTKFVGAKYIGYHVFHGAYAPDANDRLAEDETKYISFITK